MGAGLLFALVIAEVALRAATLVSAPLKRRFEQWDPMGILIEPHGSYGYRQKPGAVYHYENQTSASANAQGWRGPDVAIPKPAGTLRVVLLGESTTHGWGVNDSETIDTYLRGDLSRQLGRPVEAVNLAFDGYDSWQLLQRLESDGLRLQPDLLIVNTGINDVRNANFSNLKDPDPRTLIWETDLKRLREERARGGPTFGTRIKHWSYVARLVVMIHNRQPNPVARVEAIRVAHVYPDAAANFARNLHRIDSVAAAHGIPVIYSTPASALRTPKYHAGDVSGRTYWIRDAATTQAYRDTLASRLEALADSGKARGRQVVYISYQLPPDVFLDDCHLTPQGNRMVAGRLAELAAPMLRSRAGL